MDSNLGILLLFGCLAQLIILLLQLQLCESQSNICSNHGGIRLVNGTGPYEGRLEICHNGVWKTVCDDQWSTSNAKVVCSQLNYPPQDALSLYGAPFGQGSGLTLEFISCTGSEQKLIDCSNVDYPEHYNYCHHSDGVGVRCLSCNTHPYGAVRLRGSSLEHRGRVEICVNSVWGTVCDDYWDSTDANVVCKQLGYSRFGSRAYHGAYYGAGTGPIHLDNVRCSGNEQRLIDCPHIRNTYTVTPLQDCSHVEDAAVSCQTALRCQEGSLRLTGEGQSTNQGRVEICEDETWGTICATNWASPTRFHVTCTETNWCTLTWQPPPLSRESILNYFVNCSTHSKDARRHAWTATLTHANVHRWFQAHRLYNCCVAAVNEAGRGDSICHTIITHETAPAAAPVKLDAHQLNSTSIFLSWSSPPFQYQNGIIRGYYLHIELNSTDETELSEVTSTEEYIMTQDQHLLMDDLQPFAMYTCRVAAYTVKRGPFSQPLTIVLSSEEAVKSQSNATVTLTVATISTLLIIIIILVGICVAVQTGYRIAKSKKRRRGPPVQNQYGHQDVAVKPKPRRSVENTPRRSNSQNTLTATKLRENKQQHHRDTSHTIPPRVPTRTHSLNKIDKLENVQLQVLNYPEVDTRMVDSEHIYQPLILLQCSKTSTAHEYQSLTQLR